jgi:hypothetical protein
LLSRKGWLRRDRNHSTCAVPITADDNGVGCIGGVRKSASDTAPGARSNEIEAAAADTAELAASVVSDAATNAGEKPASGVVESATDTYPKTIDGVPLACDQAAESGLSKPVAAADH